MAVSYEPVLVLLSIAVAIIGSLTSLALTSGSHDGGHESWEASFSLANGGLIMGTTIWSMHFIAMMAVQFPVLINYNIVETVLSIGMRSARPRQGSTLLAPAGSAISAFPVPES